MPMFRKKPVVIEARQFDGSESSRDAIFSWLDEHEQEANSSYHDGRWIVTIPTLEGSLEASPGDWIIRGVKGEFYPCKPDIFEKTYDPQ